MFCRLVSEVGEGVTGWVDERVGSVDTGHLVVWLRW